MASKLTRLKQWYEDYLDNERHLATAKYDLEHVETTIAATTAFMNSDECWPTLPFPTVAHETQGGATVDAVMAASVAHAANQRQVRVGELADLKRRRYRLALEIADMARSLSVARNAITNLPQYGERSAKVSGAVLLDRHYKQRETVATLAEHFSVTPHAVNVWFNTIADDVFATISTT